MLDDALTNIATIAFLMTLALTLAMTNPTQAADKQTPSARVASGAEVLAASNFASLNGKRVGLITNHTGLVGEAHLADVLHTAPGVTLAAIFGPEHGFRGRVEAGAQVKDGIDPKTGVRVFSLYGSTKKPTQKMLRGLDVLVFDIQDIGARFYTYISTMGLAMQAAAQANIPFIVLDRPNPLGGNYVSGYVLETSLRSFVGQFPIPIVHGLTVAELAAMIKGERMLKGLEKLDLQVMKMEGWQRSMRWRETKRKWVATSPNIPTFLSALVYPGIGIIGETQLANEGTGTDAPFTVFGAPWLDAKRMTKRLNALSLPGVKFEATSYRPRSIPGVAPNPRYVGQTVNGVRLVVTDVNRIEPLEIGIHALAMLIKEARSKKITKLFAHLRMFHLISGTKRLHRALLAGSNGHAIIASWKAEVVRFKEQRERYLLY